MIIWLGRSLVLDIHARQVMAQGGEPLVRDSTLLDSALTRPQQLQAFGDPPPDLADLAASLASGLVRNHPFVDGNKRTAHVVYRTFLILNGGELNASNEEKYLAVLALAAGALSEAAFSGWVRKRLRAGYTWNVHESRPVYAHGGAVPRRGGRRRNRQMLKSES